MNHPDKQLPNKFETEDVPRIMAAIQEARRARAKCDVVIHVAENGGIVSVKVTSEKNFK